MPDLLEKTGKIIFLRAHDLGTGYGPPNDFLDVEAVFILNSLGEGAYGFQLRNDDNLPARQAMFSLLGEAFAHNFTVIADYLIEPGRINGTAIRVALDFATQSGPLLVIDGEVNSRSYHPDNSPVGLYRYGGSKKYRVAVGSRDRNLVVFAISESEVSFGEFARLFRDKLRCKNALFLDGGSATSFYSPVLGRNGNFLPLGPIIGVYGAD